MLLRIRSSMVHAVRVLPRSLLAALVLSLLTVSTASAVFNDELFEPLRWTGSGDGTFSLTYQGRGCPAVGDPDDYRFKVNVNRSYNGSDWKFYSNNVLYQRTPTGRLFKGYRLDGNNAYVCIGKGEFLLWWSVSGVQQNVYTWRRR